MTLQSASRPARLSAGALLSMLSGVLATLAHPPAEFWPLIFVAFVPMLVAQHRVFPKGLSGLGPGIGIAATFAGAMSAGLSGQAWVIQLWPVYAALLISAIAAGGRSFHERTGYRWFWISLPAGWVGIEFLREWSGVAILAATWGNPVYALYGQSWMLQPIAVTGFFGAMLLLLVVNAAIAHLIIAILDGAQTIGQLRSHRSAIVLLRVAGVAGFWVIVSVAMYGNAPANVRVAAVQANAPDRGEEYRRDIQQTRVAGEQGARLVVWREGGLDFDPKTEQTEELRTLAAETGAHLAMGYGVRVPAGWANEATVLSPDGSFLGTYGKAHPGRFAGDQSDTGGEYPVYDTPFGRLATIICYDLDFLDTAREMGRRGAQIVAVPSNDVTAIAQTHYTHLVFRAIENRMAMVKADSRHDSAVIDPWGRILARYVTPLAAPETRLQAKLVMADVPVGTGNTFVSRFGEWVGFLALAGAVLLRVQSLQARYRRRP